MKHPSDSDILDWIEDQLIRQIGSGEFWHAMHDVHRGEMLRDAVSSYMADTEEAVAQFKRNHRTAGRLTRAEINFCLSVAEGHRNIRVYASKDGIVLSRAALYTPTHREAFIVRPSGRRRKGRKGASHD